MKLYDAGLLMLLLLVVMLPLVETAIKEGDAQCTNINKEITIENKPLDRIEL